LSILIAVSCQRTEVKPQQSANAQTMQSATSGLYSDPDYITLYNMNYQLATQIPLNADLHYLLNDDSKITATQFSYTAKQMGFKDTTAYRTFEKKQVDLAKKLHDKYGDPMPQSASANNVTPYFTDPCSAQYSQCMHDAAASYTDRCITCWLGAVGFGAIGVGVGGAIFELTCGAAAIYELHVARGDCNTVYQACIR
jgi:hypothetical protein